MQSSKSGRPRAVSNPRLARVHLVHGLPLLSLDTLLHQDRIAATLTTAWVPDDVRVGASRRSEACKPIRHTPTTMIAVPEAGS